MSRVEYLKRFKTKLTTTNTAHQCGFKFLSHQIRFNSNNSHNFQLQEFYSHLKLRVSTMKKNKISVWDLQTSMIISRITNQTKFCFPLSSVLSSNSPCIKDRCLSIAALNQLIQAMQFYLTCKQIKFQVLPAANQSYHRWSTRGRGLLQLEIILRIPTTWSKVVVGLPSDIKW
jgi:hypothetical protein